MTGGPALSAPPPPPPPPPAAPVAGRCPNCNAELREGQQTCVECGYDLVGRYRRAPSWKLWAVLGALAALALGVGAGIGVSALVNRHDHRSRTFTTTNAAAAPAPAPAAPAPAPTAPVVPTTPTAPGGSAPQGPLAAWPPGTTAYTVVLATTKTRVQALAKAREANGRGISAGVLDSKDYSSLPRGTFVVFSGQFKTSKDARTQADGYASKGFGAAYPAYVKK